MLYNVALCSRCKNTVYQLLRGYDGRPLTFTDYGYAEREAFEKNIRLGLPDENDLLYVVIRVNNE